MADDAQVVTSVYQGRILDVEFDDEFLPLVRVNLLTEEMKLKYTRNIELDRVDNRIEALFAEAHRQLRLHRMAWTKRYD
jgi:hypothetical protein